jgi:multiple sugar transport system substrate-binding protein
VPLPNFGERTATDSGSWQWGVTSNATDGDAVWRFLEFLLRPAEVLRMTRANRPFPPRGAPCASHLISRQVGPSTSHRAAGGGVARSRPQTPAYPALSAAFARAFNEAVVQERPVGASLDAAARRVERDLLEHQYYPPPS